MTGVRRFNVVVPYQTDDGTNLRIWLPYGITEGFPLKRRLELGGWSMDDVSRSKRYDYTKAIKPRMVRVRFDKDPYRYAPVYCRTREVQERLFKQGFAVSITKEIFKPELLERDNRFNLSLAV